MRVANLRMSRPGTRCRDRDPWLPFRHCSSNMCSYKLSIVGTWEADDPAYARPTAAPLERCAELLGVDLTTIGEAAAHIQPYVRVDGTKVWSLMQLERQLRPQAYGRVRAATSPVAGSELSTPERHGIPRWRRAARSAASLLDRSARSRACSRC
jgi:hypothetical protein